MAVTTTGRAVTTGGEQQGHPGHAKKDRSGYRSGDGAGNPSAPAPASPDPPPFSLPGAGCYMEAANLLLDGSKVATNLPPPAEREGLCPGPTQFQGSVTASICSLSLQLPTIDRAPRLEEIAMLCRDLKAKAEGSCRQTPVLRALNACLRSGLEILRSTEWEG